MQVLIELKRYNNNLFILILNVDGMYQMLNGQYVNQFKKNYKKNKLKNILKWINISAEIENQ